MRVSHYRIFNISNRYSPCIPREMFASTLINPEETIFCDLPTLLVPLPAQRVHNSNLADHNSRGARASESGAHSLAMMHLVKKCDAFSPPRLKAPVTVASTGTANVKSRLSSPSELQASVELPIRHLLQGFHNAAGLPASLRSEGHIERTYSCRRWVARWLHYA